MLDKLYDTNKFKKEADEFARKISLIEDNDRRRNLESSLKELFEASKKIDLIHSTEYNGYINPELFRDYRENINKIRRDIQNRLSDIK